MFNISSRQAHIEDRVRLLKRHINKYIARDVQVPREYLEELHDHLAWLNNNRVTEVDVIDVEVVVVTFPTMMLTA